MWLPVFALILGLLVGSLFSIPIPVIYAKYLSIAVLAGLDSLLGGWRSVLEEKFDSSILLSGFFINALLAAALAYLGDLLGLDLYLAAVIAFGLRIFANLGFIRRNMISNFRQKRTEKARHKNIHNKAIPNQNLQETSTIDKVLPDLNNFPFNDRRR
jgi:small basic protein